MTMDEQEAERAYRRLLKLKSEEGPFPADFEPPKIRFVEGESTLFHCVDCHDLYQDRKGYRRDHDMPFLCEACAEYRRGGY